MQNALQLENSLKLDSTEVFTLQQILKFIDALYLNNIVNVENMKAIIQYFNNETIYSKNKAIKVLCSNLDDFYNFLEKIMEHLPKKKNFDFYKFISKILLDEFNKVNIP